MTTGADKDDGSGMFDSVSEPLLDAILRQVPIGITIATAPDVKIVRVSDHGSDLLGRQRSLLEGIAVDSHVEAYRVYDPLTGQPAAPDRLPLTRATHRGEVVTGEEWLVGTADGALLPVLCNAGPIRGGDGQILGGIIAWTDISRQKQLESRLRETIAERDAARAELDHRVKNHLMLVAGLVSMIARGRGAAAEEVAAAVSSKIGALGNAYAVLDGRHSNDARAADLLRSVAAPLSTPLVAIDVTADPDLTETADQCAPLSIIVNEAICNALKHGFPGGAAGRIDVSLAQADGECELVIANDGAPLDSTRLGQGSGSRFIAGLVRQLGGSVQLANADQGGVVMRVRFPAMASPLPASRAASRAVA